MSIELIDLSADIATESASPPSDRLLEGTPQQTVANYFSDGTGQFFAGRWSSTRGKWRIRYSESELCVMTAGRVALVSASGQRCEFGPGAAFVIPAGFEGVWEVLEDCTKLYAIFEPRA
ncbi:MAG TPA: cupin domain-containing protein [Steroidobacteraceae bacterium]|nr:cupin domain-containing protein [Steroidobacteraceae bacterium]